MFLRVVPNGFFVFEHRVGGNKHCQRSLKSINTVEDALVFMETAMTVNGTDYKRKMDHYGIPDYMQDGLSFYLSEGRPVGNFLTAVLTNNLKEACNRADDTNIRLLPNYVSFLYNQAPMNSWGSEERVTAWIEQRGLLGRDEMNIRRR